MATAPLATYNRKRDFAATPEPRGKVVAPGKAKAIVEARTGLGEGLFVVQEHHARRLHYDFRLEWKGVLRSWAIPKGPSLDPSVKRMAVETEDHPLAYGSFEGTIPAGQYGAGTVSIWDSGRWKPIGDAARGFREGKLKFELQGRRLRGGFTLVRMRPREGESKQSWLLIKERDAPTTAAPRPATSGAQTQRNRTAAPRGRLPSKLEPQLATLVSAAPEGDWLYELKLDGYRILTRVNGKDVRCFTRNGNDWSRKLPGLVAAIRALNLPPVWLDGEIVAPDARGAPDFQRLQNAFDRHSTAELRYFIFDLPFLDGEDLRELPQRERRQRLQALLEGRTGGAIQFSATLEGKPERLLAAAARAGFEGLVGKRAEAPYTAGRSRDWIKLKTGERQEFVIGGFTDPQGSRSGLGALLLGVHDAQGRLRHAGNVGTGFDEAQLRALRSRLQQLKVPGSPFFEGPSRVGTTLRSVPHWTRPELVAEISFAGWTKAGHVRQAVFHGLREDKPAREIIREHGISAKAVSSRKGRDSTMPKEQQITHPERVIDKASGTTKGQLADYYARVARLILPHLASRPVALLRAPDGIAGQQFFQKHAQARTLPLLERLPRSLDPGHEPLLMISTKEALVSAAQMNVIELHTWNATVDDIGRPDRLILDIDPGQGVEWPQIREGALLVRTVLEELELRSFVKTSGGKGIHVVLPLKPELAWAPVKAFSKALVEHLAQVLPQRFVARSGPRNRIGRLFVDYLRNGRGSTTVAAWSARARPGLGISVPITWAELKAARARPEWTVHSASERLRTGNAPWKAYEGARQSLRGAMAQLKAARRSTRD